MPPWPWPLHRRIVKRSLDVVASSAALALLGAPLFIVGALVWATSPGPALFRQRRVGRGGREFRIWKLRTMVTEAAAGRQITAAGDPRVTPLGRVLRRSKIDELPQLVNVLLGDMSLVGPRPEVPRYVAAYRDEDRAVLAVRPGITDPASIRYRDEEQLLAAFPDPERAYVDVLMPRKLELVRGYLRQQNLRHDLSLLLQTLRVVTTSER